MRLTIKDIKILIVDDDADDRKLFVNAVNEIDKSIICSEAKDGQQALDMLRDNSASLPHLIFLDLRMPRLGGKKCLLDIKKDQRLKDIPVIIYTTSQRVEESEELHTLGAVHFVSKPSDPDEIFFIISFVLEEELKALHKRNDSDAMAG